jgi:SNARE protein 1
MTVKEQVVHDRVNLVRLVRRLDKSVNEADWDTERSWTVWLKSERVLQQLKHARKLLGNVELDNEIQPSA